MDCFLAEVGDGVSGDGHVVCVSDLDAPEAFGGGDGRHVDVCGVFDGDGGCVGSAVGTKCCGSLLWPSDAQVGAVSYVDWPVEAGGELDAGVGCGGVDGALDGVGCGGDCCCSCGEHDGREPGA